MTHICAACNQTFDRQSRLFAHIPKDKDCALNIKNVLLLTDNGQRKVLLGIYEQYFELTSRKYNENAYRKVRKILMSVHATEDKQIAVIQDRRVAAQEAEKESREDYIRRLEDDIKNMKDEIASKDQELIERERQNNRADKYKRELDACMAREPRMGDLLRRLNVFTGKTYKYKLLVEHLAPWSLPPSTCISDADFIGICKKYIDTPKALIMDFTYNMFKNANVNQLVYVHNEREQKLYILTRPDDADVHIDYIPTMVSPLHMDTIVQFILKEIRIHTTNLQVRLAAKWNKHMPPEHLLCHKIPSDSTPERVTQLEKDQIIMWKYIHLYEYCKQDFITEHTREGTKVEAAELRKTLKSTDQAVKYVVKALYKLNRDHEIKQRAIDDELIACHV